MRRTLTTAAIAALALVGLAAPASADHVTTAYTTIDGAGCSSGPIASGTGQWLYTDKAKIKARKSGATTWTCSFSAVGASTYEENGYWDWAPPSKVARFTSYDNCIEYGPGGAGDIAAVGNADIKYQPNGKITIECTLVPVEY